MRRPKIALSEQREPAAVNMLERLPDEISILILAHCKVAELGRAARAWRDLNDRDGVWRALQKAILGCAPAPRGARGRSSGRNKLSGKEAFKRLVATRRQNTEEARARFEQCEKPGIGALRKLLKAWQPLSINHRGSAGCTFLHSVVADARLSPAQTVQCVRELLEKHGADASRGNDLRMAPLMSAAALGDVKLVTLLLDAGASITARGAHPNGFVGAPVRPGKRARTPREWAECFGQSQVVDLLDRRAGAAPEKKRRREAKYFCLPACPFYGANTGEMVNCETCDNWFHCACVGISHTEFARFVRDESARFECAACAARQASARRVVDRSGVVWDAAWDSAGRQYYVDRATGRTSWQVEKTAAGAPGYYKARARARVVELLGDQLFSLPAPPAPPAPSVPTAPAPPALSAPPVPSAQVSAPALVATVTPPGDDEDRVTRT